jgi:hypothetical protein
VEVEETMVHVLDFIYFHGKDTSRYVRRIWSSWSVIPDISSNRITEYVIRTLCVNLVNYICHKKQGDEDTARDEAINNLRKLQKTTSAPNSYVKHALNLLQGKNQWEQIRSQVVARKRLIQIVLGYLYWDGAEQALRGNSALTAGAVGQPGGNLRAKQVVTGWIDNPLRLVEAYTNALKPDEVTSVWLLYCLAFNARQP